MRRTNLVRYMGEHPSRELVTKIVTDYGASTLKFETIFEIKERTLERYFAGKRMIPEHYWHIFYEFDNLRSFYATFTKMHKKQLRKEMKIVQRRKKRQPVRVIPTANKSAIDAIRTRLG